MTKEFDEINSTEAKETKEKSKLEIIIEKVKDKVMNVLSVPIVDIKTLMNNEDFKYIYKLLKKVLTKLEDGRLDGIKEKKLNKYKIALNLILKEIFGNEKMKDLIIEQIGGKNKNELILLLSSIYETGEGFIDNNIIEVIKSIIPQKKSKENKDFDKKKKVKKVDLGYEEDSLDKIEEFEDNGFKKKKK